MKNCLARLLLLCILSVAGTARAQPSLVKYLPLPTGDREWDTIALDLAGDRLYVGDYANTIAVFETATDTMLTTFELPSPDDEWIGGITVSPEGRLFVSTDLAFYELDPEDGTVLQQAPVPWSSWWEGLFVFNAAGDRAYLASVDEVFALQVDPLQIIDTIEGDEIDGLLAVNPSWGLDGLDAYRIALSPDGDRLYLGGVEDIRAISGLSTTTDFKDLAIMSTSGAALSYPRIALSSNGSLLFDSEGHVWDGQDLSLLAAVDFSSTTFGAEDLVLAPDGSGVFFEGFATSMQGLTYNGEVLLVVDSTTMGLVDLDGVAANGLTGIDLPEANGWDNTGSYNALAMVIHPDGEKLYMAAGSSGGLVVNLSGEPILALTGFFPKRGGNEGDVTIAFSQTYPEGTSVSLQRAGQDPLVAYKTLLYPTRFEAIFDLRGVAVGDYELVVTPSGGQPAETPGVFQVQSTREDASVEMVGGSLLAFDTEASSRVIVQNTGNVDLRDLIVTLRFAEGTRYRINLPATVPGGEAQRDEDFTVAEGIEPIWLDRLGAGRSYEFELVLAGPEGVPPSDWDVSVQATVGYLMADEVDSGSQVMSVSRSALIGELCTLGDAAVTAMSNELNRRNTGTARGDVADAMDRVVKDTATEYGVSKVKELVGKGITLLVVAAVIPPALPIAAAVFGVVNDMKSCFDFISKLFSFDALFSIDPNDKVSPTGLDGFIEGNETVRYVIHFENLADATAPATIVTITDELDDLFDLSSFELVGSSHPEELEVTLAPNARVMTAVFTDIDLPPNVTPPEGQGWLEFTIRPTEALSHGTVVRNQADIVFDINDPIVTPEVTLEVDTETPQSTMTALPAKTAKTSIPLSWSASDQGVGVWDCTVKVSENGGAFAPWLANTTDEQATFQGSVGNAYRFLVVARDRFGNEEVKEASDTETRITADGGGSENDGCGCRTVGAKRAFGWWATVLGALALMRIRRRTACT